MFTVCVLAVAASAPEAHAQTSLVQPAVTPAAPDADVRFFAVEVKTGPGWDPDKPPQDQAHFREHSAHLKKLRDAGHIVLGARYADKGLLIFTSISTAEVKVMMDQDPSMAAGTFRYEIHDFNVFYGGSAQPRPRR